MVKDFNEDTVQRLRDLAEEYHFLIFEHRECVDIGDTVQRQYHGGALITSDFANVVNASILSGDGIVDALSQVVKPPDFLYKDERAIVFLTDMISMGSLVTGNYTAKCVELAKQHSSSVASLVLRQWDR
ncbi:orotidine 5'-monophosphate decarboxylase [Ophiobolus disseminans]|uniref:Orotidine 5'-phosphate decarboxylase n=1 Tax=Ophiobolus disseminans TaxID=1469910 RepID=A0A6A7AGG7_9PLEO|nr:orotidine 5'-monophosphate decarboxylase [Ophiobolus disseminans]